MGGDSDLGVSFEEESGTGFVLGSNPVVGVDLGPDVADHAKELGQDALSVFLLGALHALHLAPGGLLHFSRQVSLGAHGRLLFALEFQLSLPPVLLHFHLCLLLCLLQTPGLPSVSVAPFPLA